jgi:hypothetical protein
MMTQTSARTPAFATEAAAALSAALRAGAAVYDRRQFLTRFPRLSRVAIDSADPDAARIVLREIEGALRKERARAGHWTYDLNRHIGLLTAFRAEEERLRQLEARGRAHPRGR